MRSFGCGVSMRSFDAEFRCGVSMRYFRRVVFDALFLTRCFRRVVFDAVFSQSKKLLSVDLEKNLAWTDLDQVNVEKNLQCLNVQIEKSAWTGLDKVKKGLFSGKCLSNFFTTGHGFDFDKRCSRCYTVAVAVSLTFSLVKN